ncbi:hypothetical protein PORY_002610 [Pneumocystis oryctolagi]|uniref:Uncharacterized protein n=1 Tax=Pneumocystis oryctolagi TaxID=42067 RepID=A0ACB7CBV0_9ASCO|nr:hypothetical protein PORY_002610 [Pneumocystis oryctolagi]
MKSKILKDIDCTFDKNILISDANFSVSVKSEKNDFLQSVLTSKEYLQNKKIVLFRFPLELPLSSISTLSFNSKEIKEIKIENSNGIYCSYNDTMLNSDSFGLLFPIAGSNKYEICQNFHFAGQCTIVLVEEISKTSFITPQIPFVKQIPEDLQMRFKPYGFEDSYKHISISDLNTKCKNNSSQDEDVYFGSIVPEKHKYECEGNDKRKKKAKYKKR